MGSRALDLLDVVEAAYQVDLPDAQWLRALGCAARPHLDHGFGLAAFEYFKPEGAQPQIVQRCHLGIPDELEAIYGTVFARMDPAIRLRPFRLGPCITGSELAYELGIAYSTVRVLLARAAAKLGVRTRRELLRAFDDGWCPPPGPGAR